MNTKKYFRRLSHIYWFYSLLPFIFAVEWILSEFTYKNVKRNIFICELSLYLFVPGMLLALQQIFTRILFRKRMERLTDIQREHIEEAAGKPIRMGKFLISEDVLISYGMFSKKIYFLEDIESISGKEGYSDSVRGISIYTSYIDIKKKSGKHIGIGFPTAYSNNDNQCFQNIANSMIRKEEPKEKDTKFFESESYKMYPSFISVFGIVILGVITVYNIFDHNHCQILDQGDVIRTALIDAYYYHTIKNCFIVVGIIIILAMFLLKIFYWRRNKVYQIPFLGYLSILIILYCCFQCEVEHISTEAKAEIREVYEAYENEDFEQSVTDQVKEVGGFTGNILVFDDYKEINETLEYYDMEKRYYMINGQYMLYLNNEFEVEQGAEYEVTYLPKVNLITNMVKKSSL